MAATGLSDGARAADASADRSRPASTAVAPPARVSICAGDDRGRSPREYAAARMSKPWTTTENATAPLQRDAQRTGRAGSRATRGAVASPSSTVHVLSHAGFMSMAAILAWPFCPTAEVAAGAAHHIGTGAK